MIEKLKEKAHNAESENKKFFEKLKRTKPKDLDKVAEHLHHEAFEEIDCLKCANCCKTTSPIFRDIDIERLSRRLKLKPSQFIEKYLHMDEDNDFVLNESPCAFLDSENYCLVYEDRPNACREYPHTDRKRFHQILDLTLKNTFICPAAFKVVDGLKKKFRFG